MFIPILALHFRNARQVFGETLRQIYPFYTQNMNKIVKILVHTLAVLLLTVLTQVGGIVWGLYFMLIALARSFFIKKTVNIKSRTLSRTVSSFAKLAGFLALYLIVTLFLVPPLAKMSGRTPLPIKYTQSFPVKPNNLMFCLMNRHYVTPEMRSTLKDVALDLQKDQPDAKIIYLDANFPFFNGFPLLPHLSHNDGRKLDLAFVHKNIETQETAFGVSTSLLGYGVCETPQKGEYDQPAVCAKKGYRLYSFLHKINSKKKRKTTLDNSQTTQLIRKLVKHKSIKKIFLEPHLKTRLGLQNESKIRFHGCHAVRHDDHIHVEI